MTVSGTHLSSSLLNPGCSVCSETPNLQGQRKEGPSPGCLALHLPVSPDWSCNSPALCHLYLWLSGPDGLPIPLVEGQEQVSV